MTQSTQKKKGRKPKAKMAVVSEPIIKSTKPVTEVKETVEPTKAPKVEAAPQKVETPKAEIKSAVVSENIAVESEPKKKVYEAEKWTTDYVNTPAQVTEETKEHVENWFAIAHEYEIETQKKSIWQKIVSFFTGK